MKTIQPAILNASGNAVTAADDGATLAAGTYHVDLGSGLDAQSAHFEWDAAFTGSVAFHTSDRETVATHLAPGWGQDTALGTITVPGGAVGTRVVPLAGTGAGKVKAVVTVTVQGKLLVLRRGGL